MSDNGSYVNYTHPHTQTIPSTRDLRLGLVSSFLTNLPSFAELLATVESTGAREVALHGGEAESVAALLRERGLDAYTLGPPRQMNLPSNPSPELSPGFRGPSKVGASS